MNEPGFFPAGRRGGRRRRDRRASAAGFEALVRNSTDVILVTDVNGATVYLTHTGTETLGYAHDQVAPYMERVHPDDLVRVAAVVDAVAAVPGGSRRIEYRIGHADGSWRTMESAIMNMLDRPAVRGLVWNTRDVSERKVLEVQLAHQAVRDELTGLANRTLLQDRLTHALAGAHRHYRAVGVLALDLDGFKEVNDSLGREAGDRVLIEVAARIVACVRPEDTVARLGSDEFAIVFDEVPEAATVDEMAARILAVLDEPITLPGRRLRMSASVGRVVAGGGDDAQQILRTVDEAVHAAKARGKGCVVVRDAATQSRAKDRLGLARDLDAAAGAGQLMLDFQPVFNLASRRIEAAEALVRWNHPTKGLVAPLDFIPIAEETGAIVSVGRWVLRTACGQAVQWERATPAAPVCSISVNVSGRQLLDRSLVAEVRAVLVDSGLVRSHLILEINEGVLMKDATAALGQLEALKSLGVRLAIDNFGTGYSSLAYLQRFPVDILKIDRSLVDGVGATPGRTAMVRAIIDMGLALKLDIVAEGIERPEQAEALCQFGCDAAQGFLFARPMPPESLGRLLNAPPASLPVG